MDIKEKEVLREKKRRRTIKTEGRSDSPSAEASTSKKVKTDSKQIQNMRAIFYYEEEEVDQRDPVEDLETHKNTCDQIRTLMGEIKTLKESGGSAKEEIEEKRIQCCMQLLKIRKLNRLAHMRCKKVKEKTSQAKQQIDDHHLQLQNLLYEIMHLEKEITKCLEFKSKDEGIDLVSVQDFYKDAPTEVSKPEITKLDSHQQRLARLDWELEQRKQLAAKFKDFQGTKESLMKEIKSKKEHLDSLQPKLATILQSTKPVQEYLCMPFDEIREQHRIAGCLPQPLYVLYMQASAYKDACDKNLTVNIQGDVEAAKSLDMSAPAVEEDSDSEKEEEEKERKKRRRRQNSDKKTQLKQKTLKKHPLSIEIQIKCTDGFILHLTFYYMVALEIMTVAVKLSPGSHGSVSAVSGGDLVSPEALLSCLYPGDIGVDTPNPSNRYVLSRLGLDTFSVYVKEVGHPYNWVQWLGGLQFLNVDETPKAMNSLSASYMEDTIRRLRKRVKARLALQKQLAALEMSSVPLGSDSQHLFPVKVNSRLTQWKRITYEDFLTVPYCETIRNMELATSTDMYFKGTVERGSAKLVAYVVVSPDYPVTPPLFAVNVRLRTERNSTNDNNIRDLEAELNVHYEELVGKSRDQLLTNQLQRLLMCFDVYLETEADNSSQEGPTEFGKEKIFPRIIRGKERGKPYRYHAQMGFFSQR